MGRLIGNPPLLLEVWAVGAADDCKAMGIGRYGQEGVASNTCL